MASNPILTLLLARGSTVSVPERKMAEDLHRWLENEYQFLLIWLAGISSTEWNQKMADKLEAALLARKGSRATSVRMLAMLAYAIGEANRIYKLKLIAPDVPALRLRPVNKWKEDAIDQRRCAERIVACIEQFIKQSLQNSATGQGYLPLVLLSTIAYGGSLNEHTLAAQVRALADPEKRWTYFGDWPQIELGIWCGKKAPPERRLWFPDLATALLLLQFGDELADEASAIVDPEPTSEEDFEERVIISWIWNQALSGFRRAAKLEGIAPRSLTALLQTMTALYQRYIEPATVSYMTRETLSSSVRIDTFARIHGFELPRATDRNVSLDPDRHLLAEDEEEDIALDAWKRDLRAAFATGTPLEVRHNLEQLAADCTFVPGKRVAEFGVFLISQKGAWGKRAALSTIRVHTRNIANLLCAVLEGNDPVGLPAADLSTYYFDILEELAEKPKRRLSVAHSLTQFHFFLVSEHEADDIDYGELGLKEFIAGSANANITVEEEVTRIRKRIVENTSFPDDPWVAEAAEVVFLIALRAPARHDEVENIRLNDILYEDPVTGKIAELFLRPWGPHTMKSDASVRRTDLQAQFKPDERHVIEAWVRKRTGNRCDLDADQRIFHWQGTSRGASSWAKVMSVVFAAMREVTKDPGFRLHHLRHATYSKMFVEFMLAQFVFAGGKIQEIPKDRWPFQLLGDETLEGVLAKDFRTLCGTSSCTRKAQFATSQRLGHGGTDVGNAYYNHAFDGWQSFALENSPLAPKMPVLAPLSGLSSSQSYAVAERFGLRKLVQRLIPASEEWCPAISFTDPSERKPDPWASMTRCWDFLVRSSNCSTTAQKAELALDFDLDPVKADRMIDRAGELLGLLKFRMIKRGENSLSVPPKPRLEQNRMLASSLAHGMANALEEFHQETIDAIADWINLVPGDGMRLTFESFKDATRAARQRDLLEHMKVPYRWISYDPKERSKWRAAWREEIGIEPERKVEREHAPKGAGKATESWIAIEPVLVDDRGKGQPSGGEAFRFVMVMSAIEVG